VADVEYEARDVNVRFMAKVGLGFALLAASGAAVSLGVYRLIAKMHQGQDRPLAPLAQPPGRQPPLPRLQFTPQRDLERQRAREMRELMSYGWVNQQAGTARLHIEEAMRLYVERAAARPPAAPAPPPAATRPRSQP
jgi:hypothetical protein